MIGNFVENAPKSLGITRFVIIFASEIHLKTYGFTMSSSKFTPKTRHLGNQEIIEGLVNGRTEAFYAIYSILENVLAHFRAGSNAVLVHEGITTKESLLSLLYWKSPVCVTPEAQVPLTLESKFRMTPIKS